MNSGKNVPRIEALDGLRGIAAAIVVAYHYLLLMHWEVVPRRGMDVPIISDVPLSILWNGPFSVTVFFVLSGFVIAAAADRRQADILYSVTTRYLRLAIPATASVMLAWIWLSVFPEATFALQDSSDPPSPWLRNTYQVDIPGPHLAVIDGLIANFVRGFSRFNNVLWTMQFELIGSVCIFLAYGLFSPKMRFAVFLVVGMGAALIEREAYYLSFVAGMFIYEGRKTGVFDSLSKSSGSVALILGLLIGWPAAGLGERLGFEVAPRLFELGHPASVWPVIAAALLVFAALKSSAFTVLLNAPISQFLGRISFGLYLVHVPLLYTVIAFLLVTYKLPEVVIAAIFLTLALSLATVFTLVVDEPFLRVLKRRSRRQRLRLP